MLAPSATIGATDCWTVDLGDEHVAHQGAGPHRAGAGVVVRLGVKRSSTGREEQDREQSWLEHRWKMDLAWRRVNVDRGRTRAAVSACDGRR